MPRISLCLLAALLGIVPLAAHAGSISGTVVTGVDGTPVEGAEVEVGDATNQLRGSAFTDASGAYRIDGLAAAVYTMNVTASGFVQERYDGITCVEGCPAGSGTPIVVAADAEITGIDIELTRLGEIAGRVTDASTGEPITDARVEARGVNGTSGFGSAPVQADGTYRMIEMPPGEYAVVVEAGMHQGELFENVPCHRGFFACPLDQGTPVPVALDAVATVDFELELLGEITGRVTDEATGEGVSGVVVTAHRVTDFDSTGADTRFDGSYSLLLPAGEYTLVTKSFGRFVDEVYNDRLCEEGVCETSLGDRVAVELSTTTAGIDIALGTGGEITGRVLGAASGQPIAGIGVVVFNRDGVAVGAGETGVDGRYSVRNLNTGTYTVRASRDLPRVYQTQLYDHVACPILDCDPTTGTPVDVTVGESTAGIDFDLVQLGQIEGTIRDESTGQAIPFADITVFVEQGGVYDQLQANAEGVYLVRGLPEGQYFVAATADEYLGILYPSIPCPRPRNDCDATAGQPVTATFDTVTSGIDITLPVAGSISGVVRTTFGEPVERAPMRAYDATGFQVGFELSEFDGTYRFLGLESGEYFVTTTPDGMAPEIWDDKPCAPFSGCDPLSGDPIAVTLGRETGGIDFTLARRGTIQGTILDADSLLPTGFTRLTIWTEDGIAISEDRSSPSGTWRSEPLPAGRYFVTTTTGGYDDQLWDGRPCEPSCDPTSGTPIEIADDVDLDGIDFRLRRSRGVLGKVTGTDSPVGVGGVLVSAWRLPDGTLATTAVTGPTGVFSTELGAGDYTFSTWNDQGAVDELWDDIPCPGSALDEACDPVDGDPVTVPAEGLRTGIDFALEGLEPGCQDDGTTVCLADGRFRVQASWRDGEGGFGPGQMRRITDDTGYIWLFSPGNVEVVVKVLDACVAPFDRFWVFAAGLTDVEVTLTVTDVLTNTTRTYENPLGTPFAPILATDAFATCDAVGALPPSETVSVDRAAERDVSTVLDELAEALETSGLDHVDTPCGTGDHLCLTNDRFRVEATWRSSDGSGSAAGIPITSNTGYFWFFGPDNVEVVVKVLDACVSGFDRFWVFAAGLTDVEIDLTVIDQLSGQSKTYTNALGQPFQPILDTDAFDTCSF